MEKQLTLIASELNSQVEKFTKESLNLDGFQKAFILASAIENLENLLTPEYMRPISKLQGNRLGFRTDKDTAGGYDSITVKRCLIEAVLTGVLPFGNQFNIIAGNCYITKEGFKYLLDNLTNVSYKIIPQLPRISGESAAIVMDIYYTKQGHQEKKESIDFAIKVNKFMGTDAVIGKATRKARAWLYNHITGNDVSDGDITEDTTFTEVKQTVQDVAESKENDRLILFIKKAQSLEQLAEAKPYIDGDQELQSIYADRLKELNNGQI